MKYFKLLLFASTLLCCASCEDRIMKWYKDPSHGEVAAKELPLPLAEKITRYDKLKTYTDFVLGAGVGLDLYMTNETYRNIVNDNFDEVTIGYNMKHGAMVNSKGEIDFTKVDAMLALLQQNGLTLFGHTLLWHQNQNAAYLNSLIAATVIPGSAGANLVTNGDFDTDISGWGSWGGGKVSVAYTTEDKIAGAGSLKAVTGASSSNLWDLEIQSPDVTVVEGHRYEVSFFIKSEGTGAVRLAFDNMANSYPYYNGAVTAATGSTWTQITYNATTTGAALTPAAGKTSMKFRIDLGSVPNMTYYIDRVAVTDLDAEPVNLLTNGKFDTDLTGWAKWNGPDGSMTQATGAAAYQGNGALKIVNATDNSGGQWKVQIHADFKSTLTANQVYTISFFIRSDAPGSARCSTSGTTAHYQGDQATTSTWQQVTWEITGNGTETGLNFDMGLKAGTYYIDNVLVTPKSSNSGGGTAPTIIEKTPEEKATILTAAMEKWIKGMMAHYSSNVKGWDALNEPMDENGVVRADYSSTATDMFPWMKYLGKDYGVLAFKFARQYGSSSNLLFINDYNLEYSLAKCDGLIEYVKYIESKGATVDGIGTQMHISITSDTLKIDQMFQKLAASGKLIKISELDIKVNTASPTTADLAAQAAMYQYVIKSYMKYIPKAQRYGITAWGISDNAEEHKNWIPNDAPNLWNKDYARKHAYKGFADGLAGKDVSADFSGELQY